MMSRKLLYHRGVDDSIGTYVTCYSRSVVSFCLGFGMIVSMIVHGRKKLSIITETTVAVTILLFSFTITALFTGVTHHLLEKVNSLYREEPKQEKHYSTILIYAIDTSRGKVWNPLSCPDIFPVLSYKHTQEDTPILHICWVHLRNLVRSGFHNQGF